MDYHANMTKEKRIKMVSTFWFFHLVTVHFGYKHSILEEKLRKKIELQQSVFFTYQGNQLPTSNHWNNQQGLFFAALSYRAPMDLSNHQSFHHLTSIFNSEIDQQLPNSPFGIFAEFERFASKTNGDCISLLVTASRYNAPIEASNPSITFRIE